MSLGAWMRRLLDWRRRSELRERLDEELAFHLEELEAKYLSEGYTQREAKLRARRELGNVTQVQEAHREQAGLPWLEEWWRDVGLAVRNLVRRPGYSLTVVGLLAIGLAAALSVYVLTDAMLRSTLPVPRSDELHLIAKADGRPGAFSRTTVDRLRDRLPTGMVVAFGADTSVTVQREHGPAMRARGQVVLGDALGNLELRTVAGRLLTTGDDRIGEGSQVAVVSEGWAKREYGTVHDAVGQELLVNRVPIQIVGVIAGDFGGFDVVDQVDFYFPAALQMPLGIHGNANIYSDDDRPNNPDWNRESRVRWLQMLVRVPPTMDAGGIASVLLEAVQPARDDMLSLLQNPAEREELRRKTWQVSPAPAGYSDQRNAFSSTGTLLTALVASLLLLTCANLSGIMLVRTLSRHREMGVRLSLGAGHWRTCRLAVVESLVCGGVGAALGLLLTLWWVPALASLLVPGAELRLDVLEGSPLGVLAITAILCSLACALAPAWWISRLPPWVASKVSVIGGGYPQRIGRGLVVMQLALAMMLVASSFSLGREISNVLERDPGFSQTQVLTARFDSRTAGYENEQLPALHQRLRDTVQGVAGVEQVGMSACGILAGSMSTSGIFPRGEGLEDRAGHYQQDIVDTDYLQTVGLKMKKGRWFESTDTEDSPPVAVVSEAFAKAIWGDVDVLGRRFGYGYTAGEEDMTVGGIVADADINRTRESATKIFFTPASQTPAPLGYLAARVKGPADVVRSRLREALAEVEPGLVFSGWRTLEERRKDGLRSEIASARLSNIIASLAMLLAVLGVGGTLAHLVTLRQRELAVRVALGAAPGQLMRGVLGEGLRLGLWGVFGGAVLLGLIALGLPLIGRWISSPGWGVGIAAAACGVLAAVFGGWLPARRAARVDPQVILRAD